jgi:hypothetical protein
MGMLEKIEGWLQEPSDLEDHKIDDLTSRLPLKHLRGEEHTRAKWLCEQQAAFRVKGGRRLSELQREKLESLDEAFEWDFVFGHKVTM